MIRKHSNDKYLPFENAEMKQGKAIFSHFFPADKVLEYFDAGSSQTNTS